MAIGGLGGGLLAGLSGISEGLKQAQQQRVLQQHLAELKRKQELNSILGGIPGSDISSLFGSPSALGGAGAGGLAPVAQSNPMMAGPQPQMPGAPSVSAPPPQMPTTPPGPNDQQIPLDRPSIPAPQDIYTTGADDRGTSQPSTAVGGATMASGASDLPTGPTSEPPQTFGEQAGIPPQTPQQLGAGDPSAAAEPQQQGGDSGSGLMGVLPGGGQVPLDRLLGHTVDLGQVHSLIQRVRPNADPGAIWGATVELYKQLQTGGKAEQLQSAALLRYLGVIQGVDQRREATGSRATTAANQQQTQRDIAQGRTSTQRDIAEGKADTATLNRNARGDVAAAGRQSREKIAADQIAERRFATLMRSNNQTVMNQAKELNAKRRQFNDVLSGERSRQTPDSNAAKSAEAQIINIDRQLEALYKRAQGAGVVPAEAEPTP